MTPAPVLEVGDLSVSLPKGGDRRLAVAQASFELRRNETLCIVGESGSGKSMLARAIMGLLPGGGIAAVEGEIRFAGKDMLRFDADEMRQYRGRKISMIFQEPMTALNPLMTIGDQIDEVLRVHASHSRQERRATVLDILRDVRLPDPESIYGSFPHQLSGGQRQRAMIAMALILDPNVIIADEPTTALDVTTQSQILKLLRDIQRDHGTGVLFITHDFGVVAEIADRVVVMREGRIVEMGSRDDVLNAPEHPYTRALIAAVPGLSTDSRACSRQQESGLRVDGLSKTFVSGGGLFGGPKRTVNAVRKAAFGLSPGETLGIVGESGSGKSTLARLVIRLIEADQGSVRLEGTEIRALSRRDLRTFRARMQMIFQDPYASLNPRYKVGRIIAEGPLLQGFTQQQAMARAQELLQLVGLDTTAADRYPHEFSGGQRQRVGIARALALDPHYLIADEPVSALDVSVQDQVLRLLTDIQSRFQLAMVFITHDLCVAAQICDRIAVMCKGEIVEQGSARQILTAPRHDYTRGLIASVPGRDWLDRRKAVIEQTAGAASASES